MTWLEEWWQTIASLVGAGGAGGITVKWWEHRRRRRAQSDGVALELVRQLSTRVSEVEAKSADDREKCDRQLGVLRDAYRELQADWRALLAVIETAPEKAAAFVGEMRRRDVERLNTARQVAQIGLSTDHVLSKGMNAPTAAASAVRRARPADD